MKYFQCLCIFVVLVQLSNQGPIENRIVKGKKVSINDYPYQVLVVQKLAQVGNGFNGTGCGGSLISKNHVLTAAHCVTENNKKKWKPTPKTNIYVLVGKSKIDNSRLLLEAICPNNIIIHQKYENIYDSDRLVDSIHDIAILHFKNPFNWSVNIAKIRLPSRHKLDSSFYGKIAVASGYGNMFNNKPTNHLYAVNLTMPKNNDNCKRDGNICVPVRKNQRGVCHGDSGGPLVINNVQYGVASSVNPTEKKLCQYNRGMTFTDVAFHLEWILEHADIKKEDNSKDHDDDSRDHDDDSKDSDDDSEENEDESEE